jgi:glycosyltransferase involved in cell wall biosynthesis
VAAQLCGRVPGGTGRYTRELIRALSGTRPDDDRLAAVTVSPCADPDATTSGLGVQVRRLPLPYAVVARLWERELPPRLEGDVVHAPTLLVPSTTHQARLVVTIHDVVPWTHPETLTSRGVAFHRRMGERAARHAAVVLTPTEAVADRVRELLSPAAPVVALGQGMSELTVPVDAAERRRRWGLPDAYLLFVGTAEPRKGLDVLLDALVDSRLDDVRLVVVGPPGWGDVDVAREVAVRGLGGRVTVTGRVDDLDLAAAYNGASAVVLPSRAEGFGLPALEAMALGVPVIVSDDPALVEVGQNAVAVTAVGDSAGLADGIAAVLGDATRSATMRTAGLARSADFSWPACAARLWDLYRSL